MHAKWYAAALTIALVVFVPAAGWAQSTYSEDFTQATTTNQWYFSNGACLTAGTSTSTTSPGVIPSCTTVFSTYYSQPHAGGGSTHADTTMVGGVNGVASGATSLPDPVGQGALRFTNGYSIADANSGKYEKGAIYSKNTFSGGQGIQITFKTVTYRGNSSGSGDGSDGISFYLIDATKVNPGDGVFNGVGSVGGSLGYSCSNNNSPSDGVSGAYLGLGIDERGNFLNGSTLSAGTPLLNYVSYVTGFYNGDNTATGYGYGPPYGRIGLRGAGNVSWAALNQAYPYYYPSSVLTTSTQQQAAVQATCYYGSVLDFSTTTSTGGAAVTTGIGVPATAVVSASALASHGYTQVADYAALGYAYLGTGIAIANETDVARPTGKTTAGVTDGNILLYNIKITQNGILSFSYSLNGGALSPVISNQSITAQNGALPSLLRFGFGGSTGGGTNVHEIMCFQAQPITQSASSAAGDQKQVAAVQTTAQDYFAYFNPADFTGRMTAYGLVDTSGVITLAATANWDSQCVLTGTTNCVNTGGASNTAETPTSRVMLTWNGTNADAVVNQGTAGTPFEWPGSGSGISTLEENVIDAGDATPINANRLNYLRGVRTNEINTSGVGLYRARDGLLGDIIDSSPAWVGPPSSPYAITWKDRLNPSTTMPENTNTYAAFLASNQSRTNVVYVGANDGFLHGFRAGVEDLNGNISGTNDGYELLAYMPGAVLKTVHNAVTASLDLANTQYVHNFFVDATPGTGDLYYANAWHTWLVGGLGLGGAAIYALDITAPANFAESNASTLVEGEWSSATITCTGNALCGTNLGNTYGTPLIRRFHNGTWGAVFGNGFGSTSGDAGIYVMIVNQVTGAQTFYYLSTGTTGTSNGIAYVTTADLDGDHIVDYIYAGDLKGNVWRFDVTSTSAASWAVTSGGPLFTTQSGQPITTQLVLDSSLATSAQPRLMVIFGTGQRTQFTNSSAATYVSGAQSVYGVWDWNLSTWNSNSSAQYTSLTTAQFGTATGVLSSPYTLGITKNGHTLLQSQTYTAASTASNTTEVPVTTTNNAVNFEACTGSTCTAGVFGWYANLLSTQGATNSMGATLYEQIVSNPSLYQGSVLFNSTIPANYSLLSCTSPNTDTGILYSVSATTGGTFIGGGGGTSGAYSSAFVAYKNTQTVGIPTNETGTVSVANTKENTTYAVAQNIVVNQGQSPGQAIQIQLPKNTTVTRTTWVELR